MTKAVLFTYIAALLLYAIYGHRDLLLPLLLAVSMVTVAVIANRMFRPFTTSRYFYQIVYLFFIFAGLQYLLESLAMVYGVQTPDSLCYLNGLPLTGMVTLFLRHCILSAYPSHATLPVPVIEIKEEETVKAPILYYEDNYAMELATYLIRKAKVAACL